MIGSRIIRRIPAKAEMPNSTTYGAAAAPTSTFAQDGVSASMNNHATAATRRMRVIITTTLHRRWAGLIDLIAIHRLAWSPAAYDSRPARVRLRSTLLLVLLAGCSSVKHIPRTETALLADVRQFTERGFLFSPVEYNGEYDAIGPLLVQIYPEAEYRQDEGDQYRVWHFDEVRFEELAALAYDTATELGGDAIVKMEIQAVTEDTERAYKRSGLQMSGFVIKRK